MLSWPLWLLLLGVFWARRCSLMQLLLEVYPETLVQVIKAISNKDAPHNNYFFYNPLESCGVVETIGY